MQVFGARVVVAPGVAAAALAYVAAGVALGSLSGLLPGLHVNALAALLAAVAPAAPGPPHLVGVALLAAAVTHSFLDVVPALVVGVPDPALAMSALPGHRLVIEGRGREALRLSALGSAGAVCLAVPLALPVTALFARIYPTLRDSLPAVLAALVTALVATERGRTARLGAVACALGSGALGAVVLSVEPGGPLGVSGTLGPLFAGLFGAPVLVDALRGGEVPRQGDPAVRAHPGGVAVAGGVGTLCGAAVGYLPGVSSGVAATLALGALPTDTGDRAYVVATSAVNTANAVFALFALVALGDARTGVLVALNEARLPLNVPLYLAGVGVAAAVGATAVVPLGDRALSLARRLPYGHLSLAVLVGLACLAWGFGGVVGVGVFLVAAALGLVPPRVGCRRVHLMGALLVPLAL